MNVNKLNEEFPDLSASLIHDVWDTHKEIQKVREVLSHMSLQDPEPLERKLESLKDFLHLGKDVIIKLLQENEYDVDRTLIKLVELESQKQPPANLDRLLAQLPEFSDLGRDFIVEVLRKNNWDTDKAIIPLLEAKNERERAVQRENREKKLKEEQLKRLKEEQERKLKEEEQLLKLREEEQLRKLREEEKLRKLKEEELKRLREEEQLRKLKEEELMRKLKEEEQLRVLREEERIRKLKLKEAEEEQERRLKEELIRKGEEEMKRKEEEYRRKEKREEESRKRDELIRKEEELRKKEELRRIQEEERIRVDLEHKKREEELIKLKAEAEAELRQRTAERIKFELERQHVLPQELPLPQTQLPPQLPPPFKFPSFEDRPPGGINPLEASTTEFVHLDTNPKPNDISIKLTAKPDHVEAGDTVTIIWEHSGKPTSTDWIGLYLNTSSLDKEYLSYHWVNPETKTGSISIKTPTKPGSYVFKYFVNRTYVCWASSNVFRVGPVFRLTTNIIGTLEVSIGVEQIFGTPSSSAWIGMYEPDKDNKSYHQYHYLSGKKQIDFIAPKSGRWEFRVFPSKAYDFTDSITVDLN